MGNQPNTAGSTTLPIELAYCYLSRILSPLMKGEDASFLAVIVVKIRGAQKPFELAAELLVNGKPNRGARRLDTLAVVESFEKNSRRLDDVLLQVQSFAQAVLIFPEEKAVPQYLRAAADIFEVVSAFDEELAMAAIYRLYRSEISPAEARLIIGQSVASLSAMFRQGRTVERALSLLEQSASILPKTPLEVSAEGDVPPKIEELVGYGEAKAWGLQLVADLTRYREGQLAWRDVDPGLLISGRTGTGKTQFAQALANSCGLPLVHSSAATWQAAGHLGEMLGAMQNVFKAATAQAPCVLLIDEFDSIGNRAKLRGDSQDYSRQVINAVLESLDGVTGRSGVVVIATTNYPDHVDAAFKRPGRLDRHIALSLPTPHERMEILEKYLELTIPDVDREQMQLLTDDWSGAQLGQLARNGRRRARQEGRQLTVADVIAAMPETIALSQERLRAAAYHECGHVVVGLAVGRTMTHMRIIERYLADSPTIVLGAAHYLVSSDTRRTREWFHDEICHLFGGIASESAFIGEHDDGAGGIEHSDLANATRMATLAEGVLGMGKSLISEVAETDRELSLIRNRNPDLHRRVEALLQDQMSRARRIIELNSPLVEALAEEVLEKKRMTGDEIADLIKRGGYKLDDGANHETANVLGASR